MVCILILSKNENEFIFGNVNVFSLALGGSLRQQA